MGLASQVTQEHYDKGLIYSLFTNIRKTGKWDVPLPKVRPVSEDEIFKLVCTGKRKNKQWKRMVTKSTFVGPDFTRKPPKYERFIRPTGLRFTKAHVTHPELKHIQSRNYWNEEKPQWPYLHFSWCHNNESIIEVNVSEFGLVTPAGKVVWGYERWKNNNDCCKCSELLLLASCSEF